MGIKKLTTFVTEHYKWERICIEKQKLVIDGSGLLYGLYFKCHDWSYGGEYAQFYTTVTVYFESLKKFGIDPIVIIDGADYTLSKKETMLQRMQDSNHAMYRHMYEDGNPRPVLPLLARQVFTDALRDLDVKFCIADGEADRDIVAVANYYRCPLMGYDSDFYVFDVVGGYIPFYQNGKFVSKVEVPEMDAYFVDSFARQVDLKPDFLILFPAILGNDFLSPFRFNAEGLRFDNPMDIIKQAKHYSSVEDFFERRDVQCIHRLQERFQEAKVMYSDIVACDFESFRATDTTRLTRFYPPWTLELYREQTALRNIILAVETETWSCGVVIEDVTRKAAWNCSGRIRKRIYGILGRKVTEIIRNDGREDYYESIVEPEYIKQVDTESLNPHIVSLYQDGEIKVDDLNSDEKQQILLSILIKKKKHRDFFAKLPHDWKLIILITRYWFLEANINPTWSSNPKKDITCLAKSLILCFLASLRKIRWPDLRLPSLRVKHCAIHAFAQWQCVYCDTLALNYLLKEPLEVLRSIASPAGLFSGSVALTFLCYCYNNEENQLLHSCDTATRGLYDWLLATVSDPRKCMQ